MTRTKAKIRIGKCWTCEFRGRTQKVLRDLSTKELHCICAACKKMFGPWVDYQIKKPYPTRAEIDARNGMVNKKRVLVEESENA